MFTITPPWHALPLRQINSPFPLNYMLCLEVTPGQRRFLAKWKCLYGTACLENNKHNKVNQETAVSSQRPQRVDNPLLFVKVISELLTYNIRLCFLVFLNKQRDHKNPVSVCRGFNLQLTFYNLWLVLINYECIPVIYCMCNVQIKKLFMFLKLK